MVSTMSKSDSCVIVRHKIVLFMTILFCSNVFFRVEALNVLGLFPYPGKSHQDVFNPLLIELVERGHNLTVYMHFDPPVKSGKWNQIMPENRTVFKEVLPLETFKKRPFGLHVFQHVFSVAVFKSHARLFCDIMTKVPKIQQMVRDKEKFDVILIEEFISDCSLGIAYLLEAPIVSLQSHTPMTWTYRRYGMANFPSYVPNGALNNPPRMGFLARVENTAFDIIYPVLYRHLSQREEQRILEKNLNVSLPRLEDIAQNSLSVILSNTHFTYHGVKPMVPGFIEVGGMHVAKKKMEPLNSELETYMNSSKHGVIIFSMGSMLKSSTFPEEKRDAFVQAFSKLKEDVIWKWEGDPIPGITSNVKVIRWLPQMELLHHPKTVAFISHGGLLGTTEAIHAGIPTLFIPVFADQGTNSAAAVEKGIGARVLYTEVTEEKITTELAKVLSPEMRLEAKKLSEQWRDRESPLKVAADTVEYVAKYGGKHFRSPAQDLYWFQIYSLDVYLFFFVIVILILAVDFILVKWLLSLVFKKSYVSKKKSDESVQNNNNYSEKQKVH